MKLLAALIIQSIASGYGDLFTCRLRSIIIGMSSASVHLYLNINDNKSLEIQVRKE